tara:strand:+ start:2035 stop:2286 length:252 start_codon:yes stop_codon:yes gene_type:complete
MLKTKKMIEDIKKLNSQNIFVCQVCGDDQIEEQAWISVNNTAIVNGKVYHEVLDCCDDMYWCRSCNTACKPITFEQYMEDKNE